MGTSKRIRNLIRSFGTAAIAVAGLMASSLPAASDETSYEGETLKVVIRSSPGGGYDFYARLVCRHIGQFLPGKPDCIAQNMTGAGGIIAANYMANRADRDGTVIAILARGLAITQRVEKPGVNYDVGKLIPIGSAASSTWTWVLDKDHPVDTLTEMKSNGETVKFSSTGPGSGSYQRVKLLEFDGFPVKLITGYEGTDEKILAVARGEVDGTSGSYESLQDGIKGEGLKVVGRMGEHPAIMDKQHVREAMSPNGRSLASFMEAPMIAGRPFFAPPEVPKARVEALRTAFRKALKDPKLLDEAKRANRSIGYAPPEKMEQIYGDILNASGKVVSAFKGLMSTPTETVQGVVEKVKRGGRIVYVGGKKVRISRSRTAVTINGSKGKRGQIAAGMTCRIKAGPRKGRFEARTIQCE